ncbi:MAG: response regulator transcription factor [Defluviitaleaceae bacterium]|nr:response regulator transcription factor [Defluviitaleaceae bacterium]
MDGPVSQAMNLLIVDDDRLIRKSLEISLSREQDITITGLAADGAQAVEICENTLPDIILMDINMPGMDGIAATRLLKTRYPAIKIMMLTTFDDRPNIQQALAAGADGYLVKTDKISGIAGKLRLLLDGTGVVDTHVLKKLAPQENPALESLTPRERDIARLIAQGLPNKEIAANLFLSEGTVRNNIVVIMEKLNVTNRTQLGMAYYNA